MEFEELQEKVLEWANSHELLKPENANKQFMKFIEETFEFKTEMDSFTAEFIYRDLVDIREDMQLEMGDVFVTLIILCKQLGIEPQRCLKMAYDKIKKRQGVTRDGIFIKAEDLK